MRTSTRFALVSLGLACLACSGLQGSRPPSDEEEGEGDADADAGEAPGDQDEGLDPLEPSVEAPLTVQTLAPDGSGCAWETHSWPDDLTARVARLDRACPESWIATATAEGAVLMWDDGGIAVTGGKVTPLPAPPHPAMGVALAGTTPWACSLLDAEEVPSEGEQPRKVRFEGKEYADEDGGPLARSWSFEGGAWKEQETAVVGSLHGFACTQLPSILGLQEEDAGAPLRPHDLDFGRASGADAEGLKAVDAGDWAVFPSGWVAAKVVDDALALPLAWRPKGEKWAKVDGVEDGTLFAARGPWILLEKDGHARLLDARTGEEAWKADAAAALWPDGVAVPATTTPAPADTEPAPSPKPAPQPAAPHPQRPPPNVHTRPPGAAGPSKAKRPVQPR